MVCHSQQGLLHGSHENEKDSGRAAVKCVRLVFVFEKEIFLRSYVDCVEETQIPGKV